MKLVRLSLTTIAGVLDREAMVQIIETLCQAADWKPGDRVQTLRGSLHGVIVRLLDEERVVWRPDDKESELTALPESLCADDQTPKTLSTFNQQSPTLEMNRIRKARLPAAQLEIGTSARRAGYGKS